jgi:hypothetical protein
MNLSRDDGQFRYHSSSDELSVRLLKLHVWSYINAVGINTCKKWRSVLFIFMEENDLSEKHL